MVTIPVADKQKSEQIPSGLLQWEIHSYAEKWKFLALNHFNHSSPKVLQQFAIGSQSWSEDEREFVWFLFPETFDTPFSKLQCSFWLYSWWTRALYRLLGYGYIK